mmetsp:Transcript_6393/g.10845  ORF Transcript_6393/g.10845 Transcript_6393/m.10845 type:complete len:138 (+) Transcript_6393:273-686(+)
MVRLLLKAESLALSVPTTSEEELLPLHLAIICNLPCMVQMLLSEYAADPEKTDAQGNSPLHFASRIGSVAIVRAILANKPRNVGALNLRGESALDLACSEMVEMQLREFIKGGQSSQDPAASKRRHLSLREDGRGGS